MREHVVEAGRADDIEVDMDRVVVAGGSGEQCQRGPRNRIDPQGRQFGADLWGERGHQFSFAGRFCTTVELSQHGNHGTVLVGDGGLAHDEFEQSALLVVDVGDAASRGQLVAGVSHSPVFELLLAVQHGAQVHTQLGDERERVRRLELDPEEEGRRHRQIPVSGLLGRIHVGVDRLILSGRLGEIAQPTTGHQQRHGRKLPADERTIDAHRTSSCSPDDAGCLEFESPYT